METIKDLIRPYLRDDNIVSSKIVAPLDLDGPAIVRVIVEYKDKRRQTITLSLFIHET